MTQSGRFKHAACTHLMRVCPHRDAEGTCQAKVRQLQLVVCLVDEEVLWLEVSV